MHSFRMKLNIHFIFLISNIFSCSPKVTDKICPPETKIQDTQEYHQPRPALRHVDETYNNPLSTAGYVLDSRPVYTTPAWTPRTVIYPLPPVTRHSSRVSRNSGWTAKSSYQMIMSAFVVGFISIF